VLETIGEFFTTEAGCPSDNLEVHGVLVRNYFPSVKLKAVLWTAVFRG